MKSCCEETCHCDTERRPRRIWLIAFGCTAALVVALQLALG